MFTQNLAHLMFFSLSKCLLTRLWKWFSFDNEMFPYLLSISWLFFMQSIQDLNVVKLLMMEFKAVFLNSSMCIYRYIYIYISIYIYIYTVSFQGGFVRVSHETPGCSVSVLGVGGSSRTGTPTSLTTPASFVWCGATSLPRMDLERKRLFGKWSYEVTPAAEEREGEKKTPPKSRRSLVAIGTCQTEQIEFVFLRRLVGALNSVLVALLIKAVKANLFGCEPGRLKPAVGSALTRRAKSCQRRHPLKFTTTPQLSSRHYLLGINYSELSA